MKMNPVGITVTIVKERGTLVLAFGQLLHNRETF